MFKYKLSTPQTKNYSILFSTAGKTWPSGPERTARKYGWISSGLNKQAFIPLLNLHFLQSRRSRALAQALPALNKERNRSSQAGGFTIIEVVLVLAIAGLIFLMVFVALPALQRSQRDAQRKNDLSRLAEAIERYKTNNRGQAPSILEMSTGEMVTQSAADSQFGQAYLNAHNGDFTDPGGAVYKLRPAEGSREIGYKPVALYPWIYVTFGRKCGTDNGADLTEGRNRYTIQMRLESGGFYCIDG